MPKVPKNLRDTQSLIEIIAALRGPDGCPWDKEQTHRSLAPYAVEEVAEMVEAIESGDDRWTKEELGDVLFQVVLHSQLAQERGAFSFIDVVETLNEKMIRRHPHVFGDKKAADSAEVLRDWEKIKKAEKSSNGDAARKPLIDVPLHLPALQRSAKIGHRTQKLRFDWENAEQVLEKVREEFAELDEALEEESGEHISHELGDVLFSLAQLSRHLGMDPEQVLRQANRRFEGRFALMMTAAREGGLVWDDLSAEQKEALWAEAKRRERAAD
ncbi:MAG: nucleoside triphosphate pyrophosphohydrolase [Bdellovibrionaceae bacterium]|nr:nucleoside triphosphate pyrophosphohydrolase [Pseudobdellovibrionaceae bacterium]